MTQETVTSCTHLAADYTAPQVAVVRRMGYGKPRKREHVCTACAVDRSVQLSLSGMKSFRVIAPLDFRSCPHTPGKVQCEVCLSRFREGLIARREQLRADDRRFDGGRVGNLLNRLDGLRGEP